MTETFLLTTQRDSLLRELESTRSEKEDWERKYNRLKEGEMSQLLRVDAIATLKTRVASLEFRLASSNLEELSRSREISLLKTQIESLQAEKKRIEEQARQREMEHEEERKALQETIHGFTCSVRNN